MTDSSGPSIGRAGVVTVGVNLALGVFGFLSAALVNRLLGPEGRGELAVIQTIPALLVIISMAGLPDAVTFHITRDGQRSARYVSTASVLLLMVSGVVMAITFALAPVILQDKPDRLLVAFRFYLLSIPLLAMFMLWTQPLRSRGRFARWNISRLSVGGAWLAVVALAWVEDLPVPETITRWHVFALAILLMLGIAGSRSAYPGGYRVEKSLVSPLMRFGIPSALATAPQLLNLRFDQMIMVVLVAERDLGFYAAAVGWSWIVNPPLHALGHLLFPLIAGEPNLDRRRLSFERGSRLGFAGALVTFAGAALITPFTFSLVFGEAYEPATGVAVLAVAAGTIAALNLALSEATKGLGRPRIVLRAELLGLLVTAVLILPMIRWFGIVGAATTSIIAYSTTTWILVWAARSELGSSWRDLMIVTRADVETLWQSIRSGRSSEG